MTVNTTDLIAALTGATTTAATTEKKESYYGERTGYINQALLTAEQTGKVIAFIEQEFGAEAVLGTTKLPFGLPLRSKVAQEVRVQQAFDKNPDKVVISIGTYRTAEKTLPTTSEVADI